LSKDERVSLAKNAMPTLSKSVQQGDYILKYQDNSSSSGKLPHLFISLVAGLFSGAAFLFMGKELNTANEIINGEKREIERLRSFIDSSEQREEEIKRNFDMQIPSNPEESQKTLKDLLKERETL